MSNATRTLIILAAVFFAMWVFVFVVGTCCAQEPDKWFILDKFSGLNLYLEKTQLAPNQALFAKNVQFRKPGTISTIDGLKLRVSSNTPGYPIMGFGGYKDFVNDSDRILFACSTLIYNSRGNSMANVYPSTANNDGASWQSWSSTDSVRFRNSSGGRAAEFWRPGWVISSTTMSEDRYDTISFIWDNNTVQMLGSVGQSKSESKDNRVFPQISLSKNVRFINVEINGRSCVVMLQPGTEPLLYDGNVTSGVRYFGVADSGTIQRAVVPSNGNAYIVDNSKVGLPGYGPNQLAAIVGEGGGYWLHLPYAYATDTDSSHWGRVFAVDSNLIDETSGQFRIWFSPGDSASDIPTGFAAALLGSRYQLLSGPFMRSVLTTAQTPTGRFIKGGRTVTMVKGTIATHAYDQMPHALFLDDDADTILTQVLTPYVYWVSDKSGRGFWDTAWGYVPTRVGTKIREGGMPIRCVYSDSANGAHKDSTVLMTSRTHEGVAMSTFTTSAWSLKRVCIPFASDGCVYMGRLFLAGDPIQPNFMVFSEVDRLGAFPTDNVIVLGGNGDVFTGFAKIYDWLVIFQRQHTWVLKGDPVYGGVLELALPDEGCIAINSIVELENNVIYLSEKGWRIFDGNTAKDFGLAIKPAVQGFPMTSYKVNQAYKDLSCAEYSPSTGNIWMSMPFGTASRNSGSFLFNYVDGSFSYSDEVYGGQIFSGSFLDTLGMIFTHPDSGRIFTYGYRTDSVAVNGVDGTSMATQWSTGWLDMDAPYQEKKIAEGVVDVMLSSPDTAIGTAKFFVKMFRDFDTTAFYVDTTNVAGVIGHKFYQVEMSARLEPPVDSATVQWLRVEFNGTGLNLMDVRRLALRYALGADVIRDKTNAIRP